MCCAIVVSLWVNGEKSFQTKEIAGTRAGEDGLRVTEPGRFVPGMRPSPTAKTVFAVRMGRIRRGKAVSIAGINVSLMEKGILITKDDRVVQVDGCLHDGETDRKSV